MISHRWTQTVSSERDEVGLGVAPARERGGPFSSATQIADLAAGRDDGAVRDPGEHRRHLARGDPGHDLIQQRSAGAAPTLHYQTHALAEARHGKQIGVAETVADRDAPGEGRFCPCGVSARHLGERVPGEKPRMFWAFFAVFDHAPGACEPSHRRRDFSPEHQIGPDQKCVSRGAPRIVVPNGFVVSAHPRASGRIIAPYQVGGEREMFEVVELKRRVGVRRREPRIRLGP
jgi:hypothetical protein